jgi:hypothetical protein
MIAQKCGFVTMSTCISSNLQDQILAMNSIGEIKYKEGHFILVDVVHCKFWYDFRENDSCQVLMKKLKPRLMQ